MPSAGWLDPPISAPDQLHAAQSVSGESAPTTGHVCLYLMVDPLDIAFAPLRWPIRCSPLDSQVPQSLVEHPTRQRICSEFHTVALSGVSRDLRLISRQLALGHSRADPATISREAASLGSGLLFGDTLDRTTGQVGTIGGRSCPITC